VREYTLNYKLALNYRLNEYAVGVLLFMMFGSTGGLLLQAYTHIDNILSPMCFNFASLAIFLTVSLVGMFQMAASIYQAQQLHSRTLRVEEHKMEMNPRINPAQLRACITFMHKANELLKHDRPPSVFGLPVKPEAFYALLTYVFSGVVALVVKLATST
jgi:hypothetical protein